MPLTEALSFNTEKKNSKIITLQSSLVSLESNNLDRQFTLISNSQTKLLFQRLLHFSSVFHFSLIPSDAQAPR